MNENTSKIPRDLSQKFFNSFDDAYRDAKRGNIIGIVQFSSNFTKSLTYFNDDVDKDFSDNGVIQVFLDQTDLQMASLVRRQIFDTYMRFSESLMRSCGKARKAGNMPIVFEAASGEFDFDFKLTIVPGFMLA